MSSFFPFSSSSSSSSINTIAPISDDPHLEVSVTPSSSAFYAGETFSVSITFRNTRPVSSATTRSNINAGVATPYSPATPNTAVVSEVGTEASAFRGMPNMDTDPRMVVGPELPRRKNQIGGSISSTPNPNPNPNPNPSGTNSPIPPYITNGEGANYAGYPYSPGANPASRAGWPSGSGTGTGIGKDGDGMVIRSPETWRRSYGDLGNAKGHGRRTRSWALGNKGMTPQEMVWSLGGNQATPPQLPTRRPAAGAAIPTSHPHSRKISINTPILPSLDSRPGSPIDLPSIPESGSNEAGPSRPPLRNTHSHSSSNLSSASGSRSRLNLSSETSSRTSSDYTAMRRPPRSPLSNGDGDEDPMHARTPSYQNAYGSSYPTPPPTHPYSRQRQPTEPRGTTTVLWAYTRLVGQFHPSNQYIPPDPLLPLRSLMLHQPVGSGSLASMSQNPQDPSSAGGMKFSSSSRWQLSFGTGAIGHKSQPSLTGSLFGLAKDLVTGGGGGTLEEERRRVWQAKDLPVLETARSLLGVDIKLKEGESKEFTYTLELPKVLPPAHRGRAYRFSYDLVVSLTVLLPGLGKRQKSKDIHIPIRVWANVSILNPTISYDVLKPIIQTKDEAKVDSEYTSSNPIFAESSSARRRSSAGERARLRAEDTEQSFRDYATHLLGTLDAEHERGLDGTVSPRAVPLSPTKVDTGPSVRGLGILPPPTGVDGRKSPESSRNQENSLGVPNGHGTRVKARQGSFVKGDDELLAAGEEGSSGQAVEVLSRHSTKTSYDIAKEGEIVSVLTLIKTTFRLGETVLGVVTFNEPSASRRVLKVSAFLESHELIPEALLPLSASTSGRAKQPPLARLHAEHRSSYTVNTSRLSFSLDIPSDATPDFAITAGEDGFKGGLEWRLRIAFLVAVPRRHHHNHNGHGHNKHDSVHGTPTHPVHLLPLPDGANDNDHVFHAASAGLSPLIPIMQHGKQVAWEECKVETVECEVPLKVLAGNTAFIVRPSVHTI